MSKNDDRYNDYKRMNERSSPISNSSDTQEQLFYSSEDFHLPEGWAYGFDNTYNAYYYVHTDSGHSQWEYPTSAFDNHQEIVADSKAAEKNEIENEGSSYDEYDRSHKLSPSEEFLVASDEGYSQEREQNQTKAKESPSFPSSCYPKVHSLSSSSYSMHGYDTKDIDKNIDTSNQNIGLSSSSVSKSGYYGPADDVDAETLASISLSKMSPLHRAAQRRGLSFSHHSHSSATTPTAANRMKTHGLGESKYEYAFDDSNQGEKNAYDQEVQWYGSDDHLDDNEPYFEDDKKSLPEDFSYQYDSRYDIYHIEEEGNNTGEIQNNMQKKSSKGKSLRSGTTQHDYNNMARLYRIQRPYSNPNHQVLCLLCYKNFAEDVFFPCEHHCVCRECIYKEKICEEKMLGKIPDAYINCSLCAGIIKRILPLDGGHEVERYWDWVLEEKPELPKEFMRNFKHSAGVIEAVYVTDEYKRAHGYNLDGDKKNCDIS